MIRMIEITVCFWTGQIRELRGDMNEVTCFKEH